MTNRNYSVQELNEFYARRHELRRGIYGKMPYANFGYWPRADMSIDEACDAMTDMIAEQLAVTPSDRLLDCGCGYGASAVRIAVRECAPGSWCTSSNAHRASTRSSRARSTRACAHRTGTRRSRRPETGVCAHRAGI